MILRAILIWLVIGGGEVLLGALRVKFLNRHTGDHRARQIGVATGSLYILLVAWAAIPWIGVRSIADGLVVGFVWVCLMLALDLGFGRWVFRLPWQRIVADFDLRQGRLLGLGMLVLTAAPLLVARWRGLI
jgi:hypothetical protein